MDIKLLLEAERRGILPPEKQGLLLEARKRGLLPSEDSAPEKTEGPQLDPNLPGYNDPEGAQQAEGRTWSQFLGLANKERGEGMEGVEGIQSAFSKSAPSQLSTNTNEGINPSVGEMTAVSDAAMGDIWEKELKRVGRFVGRDKDSAGNEFLIFKGDDGQDQKAYVNQPEWDWNDASRIIGQGVANAAMALPAGKIAGGAGMVGRMAMQGLGQGVTEVARDRVAQAQGSKQDVDTTRATVAAVGGAAGEWLGGIIGRLGNKSPNIVRKMSEGGRLSSKERGFVKKVIKSQLDDTVKNGSREEARQAKELLVNLDRHVDDVIAESKGLSSGQITGDTELIAREAKQRKGGYAQEQVLKADQAADQKLVDEVMGGVDAPGYRDTDVVSPSQDVQSSFVDLRANAKKIEDEAWDKARQYDFDVKQTKQTFKSDDPMARLTTGETVTRKAVHKEVQKKLDAHLSDKLGEFNTLEPEVKDVYEEVLNWSVGKGMPGGFKHSKVKSDLDGVRRHILNLKNNAKPGSDAKKQASKLYDAFTNFVDDVVEGGYIKIKKGEGLTPVEVGAIWKEARKTTAYERQLFSPHALLKRGRLGRLDDSNRGKIASAKLLDKVFDGSATTPEKFARELFGTPGSHQKEGAGEAVMAIVNVARDKSAKGYKAAQNMEKDLRKSYLLNLITDNKGEPLSPDKVLNNLLKAQRNQKQIIAALRLTKDINRMATRSRMASRGRQGETPLGQGVNYPGISIKMKIYRGILKELGQLISRNRVVQQLQGGGVKGSFAIPGSGSKGRAAAVGGALGSQSGKDDE